MSSLGNATGGKYDKINDGICDEANSKLEGCQFDGSDCSKPTPEPLILQPSATLASVLAAGSSPTPSFDSKEPAAEYSFTHQNQQAALLLVSLAPVTIPYIMPRVSTVISFVYQEIHRLSQNMMVRRHRRFQNQNPTKLRT